MASSIHCRQALPRDANAIATAHVCAWQTAYAGHIPADFLDQMSVEESQRRWEERLALPDADVFVGELLAERVAGTEREPAGDVVGFCAIGASRDVGAESHVGEIHAINLHPRAWRAGVGRALLRCGMDVLRERGFSLAMLWVLDGNSRARAFYEACGWELDRSASGRKVVTEISSADLPHVRYRSRL